MAQDVRLILIVENFLLWPNSFSPPQQIGHQVVKDIPKAFKKRDSLYLPVNANIANASKTTKIFLSRLREIAKENGGKV